MQKGPLSSSPSADFPRWYQEVVARSELAENGPVRGTMVIRPYGYSIWERMQAELDRRIKDAGAQNAYFPLLIPEGFLRKEAEHVEGFSPELAVVTHAGGRELEEPAVVRPTSETIVNACFSRWVQSYRDLPLIVNQWSNVVRWELRPRLFLRTTEFLWQEGHTAHQSEEDARAFALRILREVYEDFLVEVMAVPVLVGRKTALERFAGATTTWTCEAMMQDGKALQMATSHELGQNFSRPFDISYSDETGGTSFAWQTSWGASTRLVGALIMAHGDEHGLRIPPRLAPIQVVVVAVRAEPEVLEAAAALSDQLRSSGVRVTVDDRADVSFGRRVVDWELKGVPVRLEIGPRDVSSGTVSLVRRDTRQKETIPLPGISARVAALLEEQQAALLAGAEKFRQEATAPAGDVAGAELAAREGFARVRMTELGAQGEAELNRSGVSLRCLQREDGSLPLPGDPPEELVAFAARAY